ncbi:unnamed protein product [Phaedon cochleariae]|uniref:ZP domain-containing protein n=1 Tax=Phaedon cochleariae TaxID=80249 RepID=A0A9N9X2B4_PHACE|nr:unnamed protein product [Phaedon cochleariae]
MTKLHQICLLCFLSLVAPLESAFPPSLRHSTHPATTNKIKDVTLSCDSENFNVTLMMQSPFKGMLFAKDFAQECKSIGTFSNSVIISLPTSGCGVRLSSFPTENGNVQMVYTVNLVIQQDRFLRQITDQERVIKCPLKESDFLLKSNALVRTLKNELTRGQISHRVGRMKDAGWSKELEGKQLEDELNEALASARAWMEIVPEEVEDRPSGILQVGETARLSVKSTLPAGIGWRVVDCQAHDGLGDSSQKLIDAEGCPVDELLMPSLTYGPIRPIALMSHQEAVARFPAFKFPDRDRLHLSCGLQFCREACPKVDCSSESSESRDEKTLDFADSDILDRLEVYNSVEVVAPEIDDLEQGDRLQASDGIIPKYSFEKTFKISITDRGVQRAWKEGPPINADIAVYIRTAPKLRKGQELVFMEPSQRHGSHCA